MKTMTTTGTTESLLSRWPPPIQNEKDRTMRFVPLADEMICMVAPFECTAHFIYLNQLEPALDYYFWLGLGKTK